MNAFSEFLSRRTFVEHTARRLLGVSLLPWMAGAPRSLHASGTELVDNTKQPGFASGTIVSGGHPLIKLFS